MPKYEPKIIIPKNLNPWPHELRIARILCAGGYRVEFVPASNTAKMPDFWINGVEYELKSPISNKISAIERNLKRASKQSLNIVFDSSRMKGLRDDIVLREIKARFLADRIIKRVLFVNKKGKLIILTRKTK